MKKLISLVLILMLALLGCGKPQEVRLYQGVGYLYEKGAFGGVEGDNFAIFINDDGSFTYTEGLLSSHLSDPALCKWERTGDILTLTEDTIYSEPRVNRFKIDNDGLTFIEEGSSNFIYVRVEDGDRFNLKANTDTAVEK